MPLTNAAMVIGANAIRAAATHAQLHSADPGVNGTANVTTAGRQAVTWTAASGAGDFDVDGTLSFTGGAAGGAVTHVTLWSASSGGTHLGTFAVTGDATFNAAGEYTITEGTLDGSAT